MSEATLAGLSTTVLWCTFGITLIMGFFMARSNFCTMGAVADIVNMGDWTRMRMWALAIASAMIGTQVLVLAGVIDVSKAIYTSPTFTWLSYIVGGFLFGFGMVLASGCGSKTLLRIGGGSLKSLIVFIVLGLFAYMTLKGIFGVVRVNTVDAIKPILEGGQDLPRFLAKATNLDLSTLRIALTAGIAGGLIVFAFMGSEFRSSLSNIVASIIIGLSIVAIWYVSGKLGYIAEDPKTLEEAFIATNSGKLESLSFVAPTAYSLELLMFWSDTSKHVTLGIAACLGTIFGAFISSLVDKTFRWEGFRNAEDTANHLVGAALMGIGGVTALGCTIGQGLSGLSTLALGSFLCFAAIILGAIAALKYQMSRV
jgi:uncharacterized protein